MYPHLFIGTAVFSSYWVFITIGILSGFAVLIFNTSGVLKNERKKLFLLALIIFIPFIIGAALPKLIEILALKNNTCNGKTGFSLWPGIIFATAAAFPACRLIKLNVWLAADLFAISIAIGGFFAKLGCFFNGCCFGKVCPENYSLGTFFSIYSPAGYTFPDKMLYPVQFFSSVSWLVIFVLLILRNKKKHFTGELILLMAIFYSITNFIIEYYRYHLIEHFFSQSQLFSITVFLSALFLYCYKAKKTK
jgi:phosphatidylglycerol:prolipoprotein diacylglycerol transferase